MSIRGFRTGRSILSPPLPNWAAISKCDIQIGLEIPCNIKEEEDCVVIVSEDVNDIKVLADIRETDT